MQFHDRFSAVQLKFKVRGICDDCGRSGRYLIRKVSFAPSVRILGISLYFSTLRIYTAGIY